MRACMVRGNGKNIYIYMWWRCGYGLTISWLSKDFRTVPSNVYSDNLYDYVYKVYSPHCGGLYIHSVNCI
jgi:hypothetical protein